MALSEAQRQRRDFNRWYWLTFMDHDGKFTHMPIWLKSDLWLAWQAGRAALGEKDSE